MFLSQSVCVSVSQSHIRSCDIHHIADWHEEENQRNPVILYPVLRNTHKSALSSGIKGRRLSVVFRTKCSTLLVDQVVHTP